MTESNEPRPSTPTAPTEPVPRAASASPAASAAPARRRPWYRQVWVPIVGALVLVMLAFGSGFVAGQATSLFRAVTVASGEAPAWGDRDRGGMPGWRDGGPGEHPGGMPGQRGGDDADTE